MKNHRWWKQATSWIGKIVIIFMTLISYSTLLLRIYISIDFRDQSHDQKRLLRWSETYEKCCVYIQDHFHARFSGPHKLDFQSCIFSRNHCSPLADDYRTVPCRSATGPKNDPKSGLASLNNVANLSGPVLSCIEADFCYQIQILQQ